MKGFLSIFLFFTALASYAQDTLSNFQTKKIKITDTIVLNRSGISPSQFTVRDQQGAIIDSAGYQVNFIKGTLIVSEKTLQQNDSLTISYLEYPRFLTKDYFVFDPSIIVDNNENIDKLQKLNQDNRTNVNTPFEGLNTLGSITRGITIGNNQNAVVNSELDLQITGKLSDKIGIRASIQDANIPSQEGGYSQSLDEFDQIFIELYGEQWNIRAGDVDLNNSNTYFGRFTKKVQGISLGGTFEHENGSKTSAFASGALVRGVFQ